MDVLYARCGGRAIHQNTVVACLVSGAPGQPPQKAIRTFRTRTAELRLWADWLPAAGCTPVAMASTGGSWRPVYTLLEGLFTLLGVNAQHITAVPGRNTAVKDAAWMAARLRHGLLRGSCMPSTPQRQLRELTRHRTPLVQDRARVINRRQAVWEAAHITRAAVGTAIRGGSARAKLEALIAGPRAVDARADRARGRLRTTRAPLAAALQGYVTSHHRFLVTEVPQPDRRLR